MHLYMDVYIRHCRRVIYPDEDQDDVIMNPNKHWIFCSSAADTPVQEKYFKEKFGEDRTPNRYLPSAVNILFEIAFFDTSFSFFAFYNILHTITLQDLLEI